MYLAANLKTIRKKAGLTQYAIGRFIDKSADLVSLYEKEERDVAPEMVKVLSDLTGLSEQELQSTELSRLKIKLKFDKIDEYKRDAGLLKDNTEKPKTNVIVPSGKIQEAEGRKPKDGGSSLIPYYEVDFVGGASLEFYEDDFNVKPAYYMDIPQFRGCTAFRAYSNSMEELIMSGNILFGTKVTDWRKHLEYGQIYGITMKDKRRYLKFIRRATNHKDQFTLKSKNNDYDDFDVSKSDIKNIWLIEGWLNRST